VAGAAGTAAAVVGSAAKGAGSGLPDLHLPFGNKQQRQATIHRFLEKQKVRGEGKTGGAGGAEQQQPVKAAELSEALGGAAQE
jgi:hypothetical protein